MVFPAFNAEGLVDVVVLSRCRFERAVARLDVDPNNIPRAVVAHIREWSLDEVSTEADVDVAVDNAGETEESVKRPDGYERPEVAVEASVEYGTVAARRQ